MTDVALPATPSPSRAAPTDGPARVLSPDEYPAALPARLSEYQPEILIAAQASSGTYYAERATTQRFAVFHARDAAARPRLIGGARDLRGVCQRVLDHEAELLFPLLASAPGVPRPETQLAQVLAAVLVTPPT